MDKQRRHPQVVHPKELLKKEKSFNDKFAVWIATHVGSMYCFYLFNVIAFLSAKAAFETETKQFSNYNDFLSNIDMVPALIEINAGLR